MTDEAIRVEEVGFSKRLADIRSIRFTVFVDEQKVPADMEMDEWDARSRHVLAMVGGQAVGTGRLLPDGRIGRVAVLKECRGSGVGLRLMEALVGMGKASGAPTLRLAAQTQARAFYEGIGFRTVGETFMEAGIEHIDMELPV